LASGDRVRWLVSREEGEEGAEETLDLAALNRKGRAARAISHRPEVGQEVAAGLEEVENRLDVIGAPLRIDCAKARVLPDHIEKRRVEPGEIKNIPAFETEVPVLIPADLLGLIDRGLGKIKSPDLIAQLQVVGVGPGQLTDYSGFISQR